MNIYVSNLGASVTNDALRAMFGAYGTVSSCRVIKDHITGVSRGFGFVEMADDNEAEAAINQIDGSVLDERKVSAQRAKPKPGFKGTLIERLRGY
jgi:RNA recognition motif-containing protein